jgi:hypothetical protein
MLSLTNASICDVCAEEYSSARVPHCIPCGARLFREYFGLRT